VTEQEIIQFTARLAGVDLLTAGKTTGAPEIAWGDSFFYYDPDWDITTDKRFPFATIVTKNYPGFDEASNVDRDGIFRLNISVGRRRFEELIGYPPSQHAEHEADFDYSTIDTLIPHPVYATQAWVSILNPGEQSGDQARSLLTEAHARASAGTALVGEEGRHSLEISVSRFPMSSCQGRSRHCRDDDAAAPDHRGRHRL